MNMIRNLSLLLALLGCSCQLSRPAYAQTLSIDVASKEDRILLQGSDARQQCLVTLKDAQGLECDVTRNVTYAIFPSDIATIDASGQIVPLQNGVATLTVSHPQASPVSIQIVVENWGEDPAISFSNQVIPIFTKFGCNGGGCHGKAAGQNGFKLSLLGFEWQEDYDHLVKESRGRRLNPAAPDSSLLLTKAINAVPHGGGQRMELNSQEYRVLRRWIAQGMKPGRNEDRRVVSISVTPRIRRMLPAQQQQLSVIAQYSDGTQQDVTPAVQFETNDNEMADVNSAGLVSTKDLAGEVAIMARYQGQVDVFRASVPIQGGTHQWPVPDNSIDAAVIAQLSSLNIPLSERCDDAEFVRRVTLDLHGRLPTATETEQFVQDESSDKRRKYIDWLLEDDQYAEHFANKWSLILRNRRDTQSQKSGTYGFHRWIRDQIASNRPMSEFVRDILAAKGSMDIHPPVAWYRQVNDNFSRLEDASQLFLGQRIQCARCHHHPQEKWGQKDYYQMVAFFSQVQLKQGSQPEEAVLLVNSGQARASHPKSGESLRPAGLDTPPLEDADWRDSREALVDWIIRPDNPFFAKSLANRYWKHFLGRGLVEPEDDMRITNPPSNPELLDALAKHLIDSNFDMKHLIRAICNSRVYQTSYQPLGENLRDRKCFSRFYPKRLSAEQILDAVDQLTMTSTAFDTVPDGTRAMALPDTSFNNYFLTVFGRPEAVTACECERSKESTLAQSLHFANSKEVMAKLNTPDGLPAQLHRSENSLEDRIRDLYMRAFSRQPSLSELSATSSYIERKENKLEAFQDIVWSIINCKEFLFNH